MNLLEFTLAGMSLLAPGRDHAALGGAIARNVEAEAPLFQDDADKHKTAALLVAVAFRESSLRNDAKSKTNDYCALQVHGRPELASSPDECVRVGFAMLRESMLVCPSHPIAFYASGPGGCSNGRAQRISADRMWLARRVRKAVESWQERV